MEHAFSIAAHISDGAFSPCTAVCIRISSILGDLLPNTFITSCSTAPSEEVTIPIFFGIEGSCFLFSSLNKPSFSNLAFNCSNALSKAPSPASSMCFTFNWNLPVGP